MEEDMIYNPYAEFAPRSCGCDGLKTKIFVKKVVRSKRNDFCSSSHLKKKYFAL